MTKAYGNLNEFLRNLKKERFIRVSKRKSHKRRVFKKFTWSAYDLNTQAMNNDKIFVGASDYIDFVYSHLMDERKRNNLSTFNKELKIHGNRRTWYNYLKKYFVDEMTIQMNDSYGIIVIERNFIKYSLSSNSVTIDIYGDRSFLEEIENHITDNFDIVSSYIEWVYSGDGQSVNIPLNTDRLPVDEMYPFLNGEKLTDYYDRFLSSTANILLLIGPPGTGKTTFIRGLLAYSNLSALVTYDSSILEKDFVFARFIEDDSNIMVLEDSDNFLNARSDGNTMMHRFLNVGDGLVTTKGKKMIFSTNLPSIKDIDPALIRPGRCFDIVSFDVLKKEQAEKLAARLGVTLESNKETYSIAEVFNKQIEQHKNSKISRKMGFI